MYTCYDIQLEHNDITILQWGCHDYWENRPSIPSLLMSWTGRVILEPLCPQPKDWRLHGWPFPDTTWGLQWVWWLQWLRWLWRCLVIIQLIMIDNNTGLGWWCWHQWWSGLAQAKIHCKIIQGVECRMINVLIILITLSNLILIHYNNLFDMFCTCSMYGKYRVFFFSLVPP